VTPGALGSLVGYIFGLYVALVWPWAIMILWGHAKRNQGLATAGWVLAILGWLVMLLTPNRDSVMVLASVLAPAVHALAAGIGMLIHHRTSRRNP
jgi:hypothetical protein